MILARYLTGQFLPPFFFGLSIFSGVLLLDKLFDLLDLLINKGVSLWTSAQIFFLFFPTILSLSVPMALLLACLLTFGRLSEDNEILALRASGLSFRQILWPPLAVAGLVSLALLPFNTHLT
ncbi:MAG TPA: LptF/LptG family permease, partial [Elusimicrobiota bacterium]|nr:LptF/LptG family permease [Elusimicrobiota bacterium]